MFRFFKIVSLMGLLTLSLNAQLDFSSEGTLTFANRVLETYPETQWLLADDVQATLQGDTKRPEDSWSFQILKSQGKTPRHCIEFERTIMSILTLHALNQGDDAAYGWFVQSQKNQRLSRKSFDQIVSLVQRVVKKYGINLLEANLVFGDLGKTPEARRQAKKYGVTAGDHDIFLAECLEKCPSIFPSFDAKKHALIQKYAGLIHFGHLWHVEGTAQKMMGHLKDTGIMKTPESFDFEYVTHICDIAAVLGHVTHAGSRILTEDAWQTMEEAMEAVKALATKAPNDALQVYLDLRATRIGLANAPPSEKNVLARLAAMMRLRIKDDALGKMLQTALKTIPNKDEVVDMMNPLSDDTMLTPTYLPAVLENMRGALKKQGLFEQEAMNKAIGVALPWMMKVIAHYKANMGKSFPENLTLNFNKIGGVVRDNPNALNESPRFRIDAESGVITL